MGTQPRSGAVNSVLVPVRRSCSTKRSAADPFGRAAGFGLSSGMFSKYQSPPVLCVSFCQLYRLVELPPHRRTGKRKAAAICSSAKFMP